MIDGEEHYQLGVTGQWVKARPVPDLERGLKFYTTMYPSPVFIVEGNDSHKLERYPTSIPGGIPDREEAGEYWLLYNPASGSEPLQWRRGDDIRRRFQAGQYKLEPTNMAEDRGIDSEAWWQPIVETDMNYDFIDPNAPEERNRKRAVQRRVEAKGRDEEPDSFGCGAMEDYPELRNRALTVTSDQDVREAVEEADIDVEEIIEDLEDDDCSNSDKGQQGDSSIITNIMTTIRSFLP